MRFGTATSSIPDQPTSWFAWRPVRLTHGEWAGKWVWLEFIRRWKSPWNKEYNWFYVD